MTYGADAPVDDIQCITLVTHRTRDDQDKWYMYGRWMGPLQICEEEDKCGRLKFCLTGDGLDMGLFIH